MLRLISSGLLIFSVFFCEQAFAQVVDMRAYSRKHGFKAYQGQTYTPSVQKKTVVKRTAPVSGRDELNEMTGQIKNKRTMEDQVSEKASPTSEEQRKKLRQTGIKIFQEKDENKVMNFDVENPEFKKLNKKDQQDLIDRITIE